MRTVILIAVAVATLASAEIALAAQASPDCSTAKRTCLQLGDTADVCDTRWKACMQTGCWISGIVKRCGYVKR